MPFAKVQSESIAEAAASQIRELIAADVLHPNDRLPSERELCERMGLSRTSLREALKMLVSEKLLVTRRGAGLYVSTHIGADIVSPLRRLIETKPQAMEDFIKFRLMLEGECAATAAKVATKVERLAIMRILEKLEDAAEKDDEELEAKYDTEFHMSIIEAAHNVVAIQLVRSLHNLLKRGINSSRAVLYDSPSARQMLLDQHREIANAIEDANPEDARLKMQIHLRYVVETMREKVEQADFNILADRRSLWESETAS